MKLVWCCATAVAAAAAAAAAGAVALALGILPVYEAPEPEPVLVRRYTHDFGEGRTGDVFKHTFRVQNPLQRSLRIRGLKSSCSCTVPAPIPSVIEPESVVDVPVEVSLGFESESFGSQVMLELEDEEPILLQVQGRVIRQHPEIIDLGKFLRGEGRERQFVLKSLTAHPVGVQSVSYDEKIIFVSYASPPQGGADLLFTVRAGPDVPHGSIKTELVIETDDVGTPTKRVAIEGYVSDLVEFEPARLVLGRVDQDERRTVPLRLVSRYGGVIELKGVRTEPEGLVTYAVTSGPEPQTVVELQMSLDGNFPQGVLAGKIGVEGTAGGKAFDREVQIFAIASDLTPRYDHALRRRPSGHGGGAGAPAAA